MSELAYSHTHAHTHKVLSVACTVCDLLTTLDARACVCSGAHSTRFFFANAFHGTNASAGTHTHTWFCETSRRRRADRRRRRRQRRRRRRRLTLHSRTYANVCARARARHISYYYNSRAGQICVANVALGSNAAWDPLQACGSRCAAATRATHKTIFLLF